VRNDELLVYEETTGEWTASDPAALRAAEPEPRPEPAPAPEAEPASEAPAPQTSRFEAIQPDPEPEDRPAEAAQQDRPAGFWKCPSCGAINGSTATTCRMCFAPRP
jgi:hypothetical protein